MRLDSFSLANGKILAHSTRKYYYFVFSLSSFLFVGEFLGDVLCHAVFDCGRFHFRPVAMGISSITITRSSVTISKYIRDARAQQQQYYV
jgi:hypothetical protein